MDKEHLIDLISDSFIYEGRISNSKQTISEFKHHLKRLNLD